MNKTVSDKALENQDLQSLGMDRMAYLRPGKMDGVNGYAICAADGNVIGFAPDRTKAMAAIIQHDMEPVALH